MLGRVAGRVYHVDNDVAERQAVAILHRMEPESDLRAGVQDVFGTRLAGEGAAGGTMVGMDMAVDDEANAHAGIVGDPEIWCDVAYRVHDSIGRVPAAAEQIRDANRVGVEELTQDHADLPQRYDRFS